MDAHDRPGSAARLLAVLGLLAAAICAGLHASRRPDPAPAAAGAPAFPVNPNTATEDELLRIPGMTPRLARGILDLRARHGSIRRVEELLEVPGIGPKTLEKLDPHLQVPPESAEH